MSDLGTYPPDGTPCAPREAQEKAWSVIRTVGEYMRLMEAAPLLKATGLEGDYRILGQFNDTVLAGHFTRYGVQFITWDWNQDHTAVSDGCYMLGKYEEAKQDFAVRSGLVPQEMFFTPDQLRRLDACCASALAHDDTLTFEQEQMVSELREQLHTHFEHADGTLFRPFGTTVYAMMHQEKVLIAQTFETLAAVAPLNKVRYCVFPKHYDDNHNEPALYVFEKNGDGSWDVARPCIAFWQHFEKGICKLAEMGIQSDLILFHPYDRWGFSSLTMQECEVYLDYLLRRLSAFPIVWWSMANEYDICFARTTEDWHRFEDIITGNDPYRHLLGNHHCLISYDHARPMITHLSIQSANVDKAADWIKQYGKPVVYDEACYEGDLPLNWGNISAREMTRRFWMVFTAGAYCTHGEVFLSEDEMLWWAKGGVLKGQSPARIAFLKSIFDEIPGPLTKWGFFTSDMQFTPKEEKNLRRILAMRAQLSEAELDALNRKDRDCRSRCGDEVFLQYLGLHCNAVLKWKLPENHRYRVEVIDTWAMTRTVVMEAASGLIGISLPGREDMAVLAVKID